MDAEDGSRLPERRERDGRPVPALSAKRHRPGGFHGDPSVPTRETCWNLLSPVTRERLCAKAGGVLHWFARLDEAGRPTAVVFGPHGLCEATPVTHGSRSRYLVERLPLDPDSTLRTSFDERRPTQGSSALARILRRPRPRTTAALDLPMDARNVLGNFPDAVQDFLQGPFLPDDLRVVADWYFEESLDLAHQSVFVVFCLSADRNVTLASGIGFLPRQGSWRGARWKVECYHARVRRV